MLRNRRGIDNHLRNSDENITQNAAEMGEMDREQELRDLNHWATNLRSRGIPGVTVPRAQYANLETETEML